MTIVHRACDRVIHGGLKALIVFTPLAFGTVEPWSIALMEWGIVTLVLVYLLSRLYPGGAREVAPPRTARRCAFGLTLSIGLFLLLCAAQLVPLPMSWLRTISPGSARMYESVDFQSWERIEEQTEGIRNDHDDPVLRLRASDRRPISVNPGRSARQGLLVAVLVSLFFLVAKWADEERAVSLLRWIAFVGFVVSAFGLVQLLTWNRKIYWFRNVPNATDTSPAAFGPFVNHNHFAGYVGMAIPVALSLTFWLVDRRRRDSAPGRTRPDRSGWKATLLDGLGDERGRLSKGSLALFATVILIVSLFFSMSRGGILSSFVSGTVLLVLLCGRIASRALRWSVGLALPIIVVSLISFIGAEAVKRQLGTYGNLKGEASFQLRAILWQRLVEQVPSYVWVGAGLGAFEDSFGPVTPAGSARRWDRAHNDYLQLLWETGIVGVLLFACGVAIFARRYWWPALRDFRRPIDIFRVGISLALLSIALHSVVDFSLQIGANAFLCSLLAGLLVALHVPAGGDATGRPEARPIEGPWGE